MDNPRCETCRFWLESEPKSKDDSGYGPCRRYPPHLNSQFPYTTPDNWCGEYQPATEATAEQRFERTVGIIGPQI